MFSRQVMVSRERICPYGEKHRPAFEVVLADHLKIKSEINGTPCR
jgi:hypothetical protein